MQKSEAQQKDPKQYSARSGLKIFMFAVTFFLSGLSTINISDNYISDFWRIRKCKPDGYERGAYMTGCVGTDAHKYYYHFGSMLLGIETEAVQNAQNVDVLIFGNSRTFRSFSTDAIDTYFRDKNLTYMVLALEGASFRSAIHTIESLNLKPKILMINNEIFYSDKVSPAFRAIIDFPEKYESRYTFFHEAQTIQKDVCSSNSKLLKKFYCEGDRPASWRSSITGRIEWNVVAEPEKQVLVKYDPAYRASLAGRFINHADELFSLPRLNNTCPVLYLVNSPSSSPELMEKMANILGIQSSFQDVDDLYTYDSSHLDRPNSEKWALEFVKALDTSIDYCLAGNIKNIPKNIDISTSIVSGLSDFETWKAVANIEVTNKAASAPDGTPNADRISFAKAGAKLQKIYRSQEIEQGANVTFGIWLWAENYTSTRLQIISSCSAQSQLESTIENIVATPTPRRYEIKHRFEHDQKCALIQIVGLKSESKLFAWQGDYNYVPPIGP